MKDVKTLGRELFNKAMLFVALLWYIHYAVLFFGVDDTPFTTSSLNSWWTIFTGGLLHADLAHLAGNTVSLMLTVPLLLYLYKKDFWKVTVLGYLGSGIAAYMTDNYTVGISGVVFAYMFYIIFRGMGSKDKERFYIAMILLLINGAAIYSLTPLARHGIAWYSHLGGAISAYIYARIRYRR